MNVDLIRKAVNVEPEKIDMDDWSTPCGTAGCIAGNALLQNGIDIDQIECMSGAVIQDSAEKILGLDHAQGNRLFMVSYWPSGFHEGYEVVDADYNILEPGTVAYRDRIKEYAEYFIATDGRE